jgi:hypothetical protein
MRFVHGCARVYSGTVYASAEVLYGASAKVLYEESKGLVGITP